MPSKKTDKASKILAGVAIWCAYYRSNPHRFAHDYLHLELYTFQKIMLVMMNWSSVTVFIGSRGVGKTFLSAVFCVIRCILYPGTKICIASGTRDQAAQVIDKIILELKPNSRELAAEIDDKETKTNGSKQQIVFKNTSYIKVVTASDSARGNRANLLLIDEFRMVSKDVIDTILRKFLTQQRMPKFAELSKDERIEARAKEKNKTMYLSSAYFVDHWSFRKCTDTCRMMLNDLKQHFVCGFPYQLPLAEGMIDRDIIEEEMLESDFNEIKFQMEYEGLWYGADGGTFFDYPSIAKNRHIKYPMLPDKLAVKLMNSEHVRIVPKQNGEIRVLSVDVALMSSTKHKNDATAIFINRMTPTKAGRMTNNIVYTDAAEGLRTDDQALAIRRLYDEYYCDYLVLDTSGIGLGIYDALARDIVDPDTGEVYPALSCYNDKAMAERCTVPGAEKVIWSIKANSAFNSQAALMLREAFKSGRIRLLETEYEAENLLQNIRGYKSLSPAEKLQLKMPYIHTTLLIDELTKLQHEESGGKIRIKERYGERKDRYSSLSYNYYVSVQLENKFSKKRNVEKDEENFFIIRPPSSGSRKVVRTLSGRNNATGWY